MKKTLALIFGGESAERAVSERGAYEIIKREEEKFSLLKIGITPEGSWYIYKGANEKIKDGSWRLDFESLVPTYPVILGGESGFISDGEVIGADLAFPLLHGSFGEDGIIQGALTAAHIPYLGSRVTPSAITADKAYTKIIAEYLGIPTLPWFAPFGKDKRKIKKEAEKLLGYPMFIKPRTQGSSIGASPVRTPRDFYRAYEAAAKVSTDGVIIERLAEVSAELEFAHYSGTKKLISGEGVIYSHGNFYDYGAKYKGENSPKTSVGKTLDRKISRIARRYARELADFLGLGNISRIDFFLTSGGELYFNEINSIPGMTEDSLYPKLIEHFGRLGTPFIEDAAASGKLS